MRSTLIRALGIGGVAAIVLPGTAMGHPGVVFTSNSLVNGVIHPFTGADHILAMLASGLLAVRIGDRRALWGVPGAFVGLMLIGALAAVVGVPLPHAEWLISASVIVLGLTVAALPRVPFGAAIAIVGAAALCHGHAHAAEFEGSSLALYMLGFTLATLALHAGAIFMGLLMVRAHRASLVRLGGAAIAAGFGLVLLSGA